MNLIRPLRLIVLLAVFVVFARALARAGVPLDAASLRDAADALLQQVHHAIEQLP